MAWTNGRSGQIVPDARAGWSTRTAVVTTRRQRAQFVEKGPFGPTQSRLAGALPPALMRHDQPLGCGPRRNCSWASGTSEVAEARMLWPRVDESETEPVDAAHRVR